MNDSNQRASRRRLGGVAAVAAALVALGATGCTTVAEHRKLEKKVIDLQRARGTGDTGERLANLAAEVDELQAELRALRGQLEEVQRLAEEGVQEARKARREAAQMGGVAPEAASAGGAGTASGGRQSAAVAPAVALPDGEPEAGEDARELSQELKDYKAGMAAWRAGDTETCIDRFREFLQTHASSSRADDAAFWMADCHYKQGEYKNAVLRFDDVVRNYPSGNKAPDALYRQGESLMKLGPGYHQAAKKAFERVLKEYPDSARAEQARRKLELQAAGGAG